jgi:hypothetical protein
VSNVITRVLPDGSYTVWDYDAEITSRYDAAGVLTSSDAMPPNQVAAFFSPKPPSLDVRVDAVESDVDALIVAVLS